MSFHKDLTGIELHIARAAQGVATPIGSVTPGIVGELFHDTVNNILYIATGLTNSDWVASNGGPGSVEALVQVFNYNDVSPIDFGTLVAGDEVINSEVEILTVFDDAAAIVTLGQTTVAGNILTSAEIDPVSLGTYQNMENFLIAGADGIRIAIVPSTSTQGQGRAVVTIRRA